jgi:hypothetical protein
MNDFFECNKLKITKFFPWYVNKSSSTNIKNKERLMCLINFNMSIENIKISSIKYYLYYKNNNEILEIFDHDITEINSFKYEKSINRIITRYGPILYNYDNYNFLTVIVHININYNNNNLILTSNNQDIIITS